MAVTETARRVNDEMPAVVVDQLERELTETDTTLADASVVVLGVTYRPGVEETRASPALGIIDVLSERGASVAGVDPLVDPSDYGARAVAIDDLSDEAFDAAVLVTPHESFERIDWAALEPMVVVDGRDAVDLSETAHREYDLAGSSDGRPPRGQRDRDSAGWDGVGPKSATTDGGNDV